MTDPTPHRRRVRYRGTHPRRFEEKYKEHAAEDHPGIVEHVRARGHTPAGRHVPILVAEVMAALAPRPGERGVDATLGWGGHAEHVLAAIAPGGALLGLDVDPIELPKTEERLRRLGHAASFVARRSNFAGLPAALADAGWEGGADFVFADLGVSSMQIDDPARGFSFKTDGPLDMRMNPGRGLSAAEWLSRVSAADLAEALVRDADEENADVIAGALAGRGDIHTTWGLAQAVRAVIGRPARGGGDEEDLAVRRVFQALRIAVNDEMGALDALLRRLPECTRPGGRVAFLTFHSGEDRRVKKAFQHGVRSGWLAEASDEVTRAGAEERRSNPRAAAAKLRSARVAGVAS